MKTHYELNDETICGLPTNRDGYKTFLQTVTGKQNIHFVTCKNCIRGLVARLNTGSDEWVRLNEDDRLELIK